MALDIKKTVLDVTFFLRSYEMAMDSKDFREADNLAEKAKKLVQLLHNQAWHSYHTSGTGAI